MAEQKRVFKGRTQSVHGQLPRAEHKVYMDSCHGQNTKCTWTVATGRTQSVRGQLPRAEHKVYMDSCHGQNTKCTWTVATGRTQSVHGQLPQTELYALYSRHCTFSYPPPVKGVSPIFLLAAQNNFDNFYHLSLLLTLSIASVSRTS